jgi:hypothetical protein
LPLILSCSNTQTFHIDEGSVRVDGETNTWNLLTKTVTLNENYGILFFELIEDHTGISKYCDPDGNPIFPANLSFYFGLKDGIKIPADLAEVLALRASGEVLLTQVPFLQGKSDYIIGSTSENSLPIDNNDSHGLYNIWYFPNSIWESVSELVIGPKAFNLFTFNLVRK